MQLKKRFLAILLSLSLVLTGCSFGSSNANAAFERYTLQLFEQDVASTTLGLHYTLQNPESYGIDTSVVTLGEFSTDYSATLATLENCRATLNKFSYESLSKENQLTYDVLSSYLESAMEGASYYLYEEPLSPTTGIHAQLPVLLAEYAFHSAEDVDTYLQLLETAPAYFDSLIEFERKKSEGGLFMSEATAEDVLEQCNAFISMGNDNYLFSTFEERISVLDELSSASKSRYIARNYDVVNSAVIPSYENLISAISELKSTGKNAQGLCYLPGGKEYYSHLVAEETGSSRSVDDVLALIQSQIADDLLGIQNILTESPNVVEDAAVLEELSPDLILQNLESEIENAFPTAANVSVQVKYVPSALEPYLSPAFYLTPPIDNFSENVIYINRGNAMENLQLFTTLAHEGYPGHLYQTTYYASKEPNPLRTLFNFKGYVEGWATYAEMCSYYLTSLEKSTAGLLQKNNSLILGLYAMADIGIHYGGWNVERLVQFFHTYGIDDEVIIQEIYDIIVSDPANYLAYYVGYLEILELKKEAMRREGKNFSQKDFHRKLLEIGPAPFKIVKKWMN